jgi:hypothetical protein
MYTIGERVEVGVQGAKVIITHAAPLFFSTQDALVAPNSFSRSVTG